MATRKKSQKRAGAPKLKQPPRAAQPSAAERESRVSTVMTMLLSGARRIEVVQFSAKTWGIKTRQADKLIADATQWIRENAAKTRDEQITEHIGRMDTVYRSAFGAGDYHAAIKAQQDKAKLIALYPDPKLKVESWQDEVMRLLREGKVGADDVLAEFGDTNETRKLIVAAGIPADAGGQTAGEGGGQAD